MTKPEDTTPLAVGSPVDRGVRRLLDDEREDECQRCHGDGMDPWNDYMLPCPLCDGGDL
jgi:DnaJ-class molecular chaperone